MFLQYTKYRDIDAVTWHDACHVTKSPRLSLRFSLGRVKGQTWNYCAEGGRASHGNEATVFPPPHLIITRNAHGAEEAEGLGTLCAIFRPNLMFPSNVRLGREFMLPIS